MLRACAHVLRGLQKKRPHTKNCKLDTNIESAGGKIQTAVRSHLDRWGGCARNVAGAFISHRPVFFGNVVLRTRRYFLPVCCFPQACAAIRPQRTSAAFLKFRRIVFNSRLRRAAGRRKTGWKTMPFSEPWFSAQRPSVFPSALSPEICTLADIVRNSGRACRRDPKRWQKSSKTERRPEHPKKAPVFRLCPRCVAHVAARNASLAAPPEQTKTRRRARDTCEML